MRYSSRRPVGLTSTTYNPLTDTDILPEAPSGRRGPEPVATAAEALADESIDRTEAEYRQLYALASEGQSVLNILKDEDLQTVENIARVYRTEYSPAATEVFRTQRALNAAKVQEDERAPARGGGSESRQ